MSRIGQTFIALKAHNRKALIPFITAGDPGKGLTVPQMHELVEAGADIIELGVPFSDPMADGPVIQRASERALANKVGLKDVLAMTAEFRKTNTTTPVVLMGYANPVERMGYEAFAQAAKAAGVDGVLTVDIPPEESAGVSDVFKAHGLGQSRHRGSRAEAGHGAQALQPAGGRGFRYPRRGHRRSGGPHRRRGGGGQPHRGRVRVWAGRRMHQPRQAPGGRTAPRRRRGIEINGDDT